MTDNILNFPKKPPVGEQALWDPYMLTIVELHRRLLGLDIETMRARVSAYDAFMAEFVKEK